MNSSRILIIALAVVFGGCVLATHAQAQDSPRKNAIRFDDGSKSMSLDEKGDKTMDKPAEDKGGFWMFPEAAPMTGKIVTDRPGFSDSAAVVPRGHFQIESGYTFTYDKEKHRETSDHTAPEVALRTGLLDCLEFRTKWNGYSWTRVDDLIKTPAGRHIYHEDHEDGGTDLNLGFKIAVLKQCNWMPNLSIIPSLNVPTGSGNKSANNVVPELKVPWNYDFCKWFTAYGSILGRVQDGSDGQFYQTAATIAGGFHLNECVTIYAEYFGVYPSSRTQDCAHLLSAGPIIAITDNISLDGRVAVGLNEQAPDFQASIGFGIRF